MSSFVLTWNPTEQWHGDPRRAVRWSTGPSDPGIEPGDRLYLLRQGGNRGNRGIVATGFATASVFTDECWPPKSGLCYYVGVEWSMLENCVNIDLLLPNGMWTTRYRRSGVRIDHTLAGEVERLVSRQKRDLP